MKKLLVIVLLCLSTPKVFPTNFTIPGQRKCQVCDDFPTWIIPPVIAVTFILLLCREQIRQYLQGEDFWE